MHEPLRPPFRDWTHPGPVPPGGVDVEPEETLDFIAGHWRLFQLKDGHRFSTDDVLCAWYATHWAPRVQRACDLGSGIGSVALAVAWRLPGCRLVTLEAPPLTVRAEDGSIDEEYSAVKMSFGFSPG